MSHHMPGMDHGHDSMMCSMDMTFNWSSENVCVVFKSWRINSFPQLFFSCLAVFALSYGFEFIRRRTSGTSASLSRNKRIKNSLWYGVQYALSIFLMLIYMTYNGFLILAVLAGATLGHFHWTNSDAEPLSAGCH